MTSFIEVPQMGFGGSDLPSLYVNVADIITFKSTLDQGTEFEIRDLGTEGMSVTRRTYLPLGMFLNVLPNLAREPGVCSWSESTLEAYRGPAKVRALVAAKRERGEPVHPFTS